MGKVSASELIRTLQRGSKRSLLARALGELGRIPKMLHLLTFIDDPCYRRDILTQLNRGKSTSVMALQSYGARLASVVPWPYPAGNRFWVEGQDG